jgi:ribonuclease T
MIDKYPIAKRFRGFLPVVVDLETGGFNPDTDALLEMACVMLRLDEQGMLCRGDTYACHVLPFEGAVLNPECLAVNRIDPYHPFRFAITENQALQEMFAPIKNALKKYGCQRAVLVGHNPCFDLSFLQAAVKRCQYKDNPFHSFTTFDTATLAAMAYGETILVKAVLAAGIKFDRNEAHSAIYDAEKTADLFCKIMNKWHSSYNHVRGMNPRP